MNEDHKNILQPSCACDSLSLATEWQPGFHSREWGTRTSGFWRIDSRRREGRSAGVEGRAFQLGFTPIAFTLHR